MATIDDRKVIDFGRGSLAITLPKSWTRLHGVQKGDVLEVLTGEGQLLVRLPNTGGKRAKPEGMRDSR
ncbi:MAG: AbrB/MazE/SpoVT family DNA-binding domain-containing protein [Acidobacteria bacterium]|nr:AbrB/MazE/SpoVT family DNA-binding domain-containing protein [Acidobacteriota bacterium]